MALWWVVIKQASTSGVTTGWLLRLVTGGPTKRERARGGPTWESDGAPDGCVMPPVSTSDTMPMALNDDNKWSRQLQFARNSHYQSNTTTSSFNSWRRFSSIRACTSDRFDDTLSCTSSAHKNQQADALNKITIWARSEQHAEINYSIILVQFFTRLNQYGLFHPKNWINLQTSNPTSSSGKQTPDLSRHRAGDWETKPNETKTKSGWPQSRRKNSEFCRLFQSHKRTFPQVIAAKSKCN